MGDLPLLEPEVAATQGLLCALCLCPMLRATALRPCGHTYCAGCLADAARAERCPDSAPSVAPSAPRLCPVDRVAVACAEQLGPTAVVIQRIDALATRCVFAPYGCGWRGTVEEFYGASSADAAADRADTANASGHWASCSHRSIACGIGGCAARVAPIDAASGALLPDDEARYLHDQDTAVEHIRLLDAALRAEQTRGRAIEAQLGAAMEQLYAARNDIEDLRRRVAEGEARELEAQERTAALVARLQRDVTLLGAHAWCSGVGNARCALPHSSTLARAPLCFDPVFAATPRAALLSPGNVVRHCGGGWCTFVADAPFSPERRDAFFVVEGPAPPRDASEAEGAPPPPLPLQPSMVMVGVSACREVERLAQGHLGNVQWSIALQGSGFVWDGGSGSCTAHRPAPRAVSRASRPTARAAAASSADDDDDDDSGIGGGGGEEPPPVGFTTRSRVGLHFVPAEGAAEICGGGGDGYVLEFSIDGVPVAGSPALAGRVFGLGAGAAGALYAAVSLCCEGAAVTISDR